MRKNEINGQGDLIAQIFFGKRNRLIKDDPKKAEKQRVIGFAKNMKREEARERKFLGNDGK